MAYMGQSPAVLNANMKKLLPETADNEYVDYPMMGDRWLTGKDKSPEGGGYCFIRTENKMPNGKGHLGFVWGPGQFGFGYYHLLTRDAHKTLYHRINNKKVFTGPEDVTCGCFGGSGSDPDDIPTALPIKLPTADYDVLRILFHGRSLSSRANDEQARLDQQKEASNWAEGEFMTDHPVLFLNTQHLKR